MNTLFMPSSQLSPQSNTSSSTQMAVTAKVEASPGNMGLVHFTFPLILLAFSMSLPLLIPTRTLVARLLLLWLLLVIIGLVARHFTSGFPGKFPTVFRHVRRATTDFAASAGIGLLDSLAFQRGGGCDAVSKRGALSL